MKIYNNKPKAIQEHLLFYNYSPSSEDFFALTRESNDFKLKIMESLLIAREETVLNKVDSTLLLELFWYNINGYQMLFYHINDSLPFNWAYTIVVCSVFNIMLQVLEFY